MRLIKVGVWITLDSSFLPCLQYYELILATSLSDTQVFFSFISVLQGKRKRTSHSADSSLSSHESSQVFSAESESELDEKHKHRKHKRQKSKRSKKKRRESQKEDVLPSAPRSV